MSKQRRIILPTHDEDAAITTAAQGDPDALPLTKAELAQFKPAQRNRPSLPSDERKIPVSLHLDPRVLIAFKSTGDGWQGRINEALLEWAERHRLLPKS